MEWISVKDKLPEYDFTDVLVCLRDKRSGLESEYFVAEACLVRKEWSMTLPTDDDRCLEVVAWMPLPEFPKGDFI